MSSITVTASATVRASANQVYSILADYQTHHPHILPKAYFVGLTVEAGGNGAGTVFRSGLKMFGKVHTFRMRVSEPEPGRVLAERDLDTDLVPTFRIEPSGDDLCEVTIATSLQRRPGLKGWLERVVAPRFLRRVYRAELKQLEEYAQNLSS